MQLLGIGTIALFVYIVSIIVLNVALKRKMAEAMMISFIILLLLGAVTGSDMLALLLDGLGFALKQEVVYASMAFVYMAHIMGKTGVVERLVNILNSLIGRLRGGSGYVSVFASALFGMISGSGSGSASAVGSITIPWMKQTGWNNEAATSVVAGNAGLCNVFPPSSAMFLLLGMPVIAGELTGGQLYMALFSTGFFVLAYRLLVVRYYVKKYNIQAVPSNSILPLGQSLKSNWTSLLIFLGVATPIILTMGPVADMLTAWASFGADGVDSISMILWIPILITVIALIEGRKLLPKTAKGWWEFNTKSIGKYSEVGCLLFFAFASSRVLIKLGLEENVSAIFAAIGQFSPVLVALIVALLISMMVGPFTATATTTAVGAVAYMALRSIGVDPATSCVAILMLVSNEGCMPPNSAPVYIASGIAGLENPVSIFKNLILHFAIPMVVIAMLVIAGIIPVFS